MSIRHKRLIPNNLIPTDTDFNFTNVPDEIPRLSSRGSGIKHGYQGFDKYNVGDSVRSAKSHHYRDVAKSYVYSDNYSDEVNIDDWNSVPNRGDSDPKVVEQRNRDESRSRRGRRSSEPRDRQNSYDDLSRRRDRNTENSDIKDRRGSDSRKERRGSDDRKDRRGSDHSGYQKRERREYNRNRADGVGRTIIRVGSRDHLSEYDGKSIRHGSQDSTGEKSIDYKSRRSSRSTIKQSKSKSSKTVKSIAYPPGVKYRPGRIQTLTGAQEVIMKQSWAILMKLFGFPLNMTVEETKRVECFVASSKSAKLDSYVHPLERIKTKASVYSSNSTKSKYSRFWGKESVKPAIDDFAERSTRIRELSSKRLTEKFEPSVIPSNGIINAFVNHYKSSYEYAEDYISSDNEFDSSDKTDDDDDDHESLITYVTAQSDISSTPIDFQFIDKEVKNVSKKKKDIKTTGKDAIYKTLYQDISVPKTPIDVHADDYAFETDSTPEQLQKAILSAMRNDLPDNFLLRFVRARKWDAMKGLQMMIHSANWRKNFPADKWLMEADGPSYLNQSNKGLIKNFTTEKAWINGYDNDSNIIFWFKALRHFGTDSSAYETQRYALLCVEWVRLFLKDYNESADTCTIVFDLTGFSLKNADYTNIKFLAVIFEAHYPESLGKVLIHNAPWVFSTVWNIIKHWLDPVVASKIAFTKSADLPKYIDKSYIPDYLGGTDTTGALYPIPKKGDDHPPKKKDVHYRRFRKTRDELTMRFFDNTRKWIESTDPDVSSLYLEERIAIGVELSRNYLELDPYIRNPGVYDRNGLLKLSL